MKTHTLLIHGQVITYQMISLGNKYDDGEVVRVICSDFGIDEEFAKEDMPSILEFIVEGKIQEQQQNQKVQLSVRFFRNDIDSIKQYAKEHGFSYQNLIRIALKEYNKKLLKEEK